MFDFLKPKILEEADSAYSGRIKVVKSSGDVYLATGHLTQSGDIVRVVWEQVLKKHGRQSSSWLILGLAGGTIAKYISDHLRPAKIIGVEIDPIMIDLGRRYLYLDRIPSLEIIQKDASEYISSPTRTGYPTPPTDFILVDMYYGDKLPEFVYSPDFLTRLRTLGSCVIFNHLFYDESKKAAAGALIESLKLLFPRISLYRKLTNLLIVCEPAAS